MSTDHTTEKITGTETLVEDLLLTLFQPDSGTIAGEGTLFYVLAGGVLAELSFGGHVRADGDRVAAVADNPPADELLRGAWDYVDEKPRGVQTVLAAVGPSLRSPVLARLVDRGEIRETRGFLGLGKLELGDTGHRAGLVAELRAALVDGAEPSPRIAALGALVSASGTLPQFHREIPWGSGVATRAKELERGDWGAGAAGEAVTRTMTAIIVNSVVVAMTVLPRT
jgi:hypothetical protein